MNSNTHLRRVASRRILRAALAGIATTPLVAFIAPVSGATNYFWSGNGTTQGGPGLWDTVNPHFGPSGGPFTTVWDNTQNDSATFDSATAALTVTLGGALTLSGLTFNTNFYVLGNGNGIVTAANTLNFTGNAGTIAVNHTTGTTTLTAFIAGSQTVTKTGVGRLEVNNSGNSSNTKWVLAGGALAAAAGNRFGSPSTLVPDFFTFDGGAFGANTTTTYDLGANRGITIGPGGAFIGGGTSNTITLTISSPIVGTAGGNLNSGGNAPVYVGTGHTANLPVVLTNTNNSWNGNLSVTGSTVRAGASGVIPDTASINLISGASFDVNGFTETVRTVQGTGGNLVTGAGTVIIANPNGETYNGVLNSTAAGKVIKNGTGAWTIGGSSTNFAGEFILNSGTLGLGASNSLGNSTNGSLFTVAGNSTLTNATSGGKTVPAVVSVRLDADLTVVDSFSPASNIQFNGATTLRGGDRTITHDGSAILIFNAAVGEDAGGRSLIKSGTGTITVITHNTYSGGTTINAGAINIDGDSTLGTGVGTLTLNGGRLNTIANRSVTTDPVPNPINLTADSAITTTSTAGTVNLNLSGIPSGSAGTLTFRNDGAAGAGQFAPRFSIGGFDFTRPIDLAAGPGGGTVQLAFFNNTGTVQTFSGLITGPGGLRRSNGAANTGGDVILNSSNTYSGGTSLNEGGIGLTGDSVGTGGGVTSGPIGTGALSVGALGSNAKLFAIGGPRIVGNNISFTSSPLNTSGDFDITLAGDVDLGAASRTFLVTNANTYATGSIGGTVGITKSGTGTLTVTGINTYEASTWVSDGVLSVSTSANLGNAGPNNNIGMFGGTLLVTAPLSSASRNVDLFAGGTIESAHAVTLGNVAGTGSLTKAGTGTLSVNHVRGDNLAINAGVVQIVQSQSDAGVSVLNTLAIGPTEQLDVTDNHLIAKVSPVGTWDGSVYDGLTGQIASGRNGNVLPLWDGPGIVTSQSDATGSNLTSIGIAKGSEVLLSRGLTIADTMVWGGQTISASDSLAMYTYGGDANLDGKLNIDDYVAIDQGIAGGLSGWANGDFNYDGKVNIDDYSTVIDSNIGNQVLGQFYQSGGIGDGGSGVSAVPEPAGLFVVGLGALGCLGRRRRKNEKALQT